MTNRFTNNGPGEQNIAQGDGAIGKQVNNYNITQPVSSDDLQELLKLVAKIKVWLPEQVPNEPRQCADTRWGQSHQAVEAGDYATALPYLEQSLAIHRMLGDKVSEAAILSNIAQLHYARANKPR